MSSQIILKSSTFCVSELSSQGAKGDQKLKTSDLFFKFQKVEKLFNHFYKQQRTPGFDAEFASVMNENMRSFKFGLSKKFN